MNTLLVKAVLRDGARISVSPKWKSLPHVWMEGGSRLTCYIAVPSSDIDIFHKDYNPQWNLATVTTELTNPGVVISPSTKLQLQYTEGHVKSFTLY